MSHNQTMDKTLLSLLPENLEDLKILDVGFGYGYLGHTIRTRKNGTPYIEGIDRFHPYVEKQRILGVYDRVIQGDARKLPYESQSFDIVLAMDIIEHLEHDDGLILIEEIERVSKRDVILSTPFGYSPQEECDNNEYQRHLSGWSPEELKSKGYETIILNGENLTKSIRIIDDLRRKIFQLPTRPRYIIAYKKSARRSLPDLRSLHHEHLRPPDPNLESGIRSPS